MGGHNFEEISMMPLIRWYTEIHCILVIINGKVVFRDILKRDICSLVLFDWRVVCFVEGLNDFYHTFTFLFIVLDFIIHFDL